MNFYLVKVFQFELPPNKKETLNIK